MPKENQIYIALIQGKGEGCDYTIACNKDSLVIEAVNDADAIEVCKEKLREEGTDNIEDISLYLVSRTVVHSFSEFMESIQRESHDKRLKMELAELERQASELRNKIKGKK